MSHILATALYCFFLYINLINCPARELQITLIIKTKKAFLPIFALELFREGTDMSATCYHILHPDSVFKGKTLVVQ